MANHRNGNHQEALRRRANRGVRRTNSRAKPATGRGISIWWKLLAAVGILGAASAFALAIAVIVVYNSYADDLVAPDELAINKPSYGAKIYDRTGKLLYEYVDDQAGLRRPVKLENVSQAFLAATIATEDDSFFTNPGVNIEGLARAVWENSPVGGQGGVFGEGSGGSSITQQLVKNVYIAESERQKRSISRKLKETVYALELTQRYEKDRILEWYVNQISYGGVYNGVEAASQGYFGKPASELTLAESALLAGIPQSPAAYDPVNHPEAAAARRNQILDILDHKSEIRIGKDIVYTVNREEAAAAREAPVEIAVKRFPIEAPHFVLQYVQPQLEEILGGREPLYRDGLVVTTTLDLDLQHRTLPIMEKWITEFENSSQSRNGSMMIMDPKKGEVLTMIGSRDYFREDIEGKNNNAIACNSPGSSFKPFAFLTTFQELGWSPGTTILDTPVTYRDGAGNDFTPANPSKNFSGPVTIRYALGNSLNIPANKAAAAVGADKIVATARRLGFMNTFRLQADGGCSLGSGYGPAIATGGVDVTLEEMMIGYSVLASGGLMNGQAPNNPATRRTTERKIDPISILKVTDAQNRVRFDVEERRRSERVAKEEHVYLVTNILSDSSAQCATFGCGGIAVPGRAAGVKTGTSEPYDPRGPNAGKIGETWAFGYTPEVVVGIWAGNAKNQPIVNILSTSISFRTMRDTMQQAYYDGRGSPGFTRPANVVEETQCVPSGLKPTPLCGKTTKDLVAKDAAPTKDDDWWQRVRLDVRNNLLASPTTPLLLTKEEVMLVLPPDLLKTEDDKKRAAEWAAALGLPLAPTEVSNLPGGVGGTGPGVGGLPGIGGANDLPATIYTPSAGTRVSGTTTVVTGYAYSTTFQGFRLEYGSGDSPSSWSLINQSPIPSLGGPLGAWNVGSLTPGTYTLRLIVQDRVRGQFSATVTVTVGDSVTPTATPSSNNAPLRP